ncbi:uncharacterized protein LOC108198225 [Daucus carota subsp. sativus]|uniref:uncharacterized protein LOC108198225 n=1 Tax=Daucus carota subsp. sativus TaxID=79200 RepID=UPI003082F1A1
MSAQRRVNSLDTHAEGMPITRLFPDDTEQTDEMVEDMEISPVDSDAEMEDDDIVYDGYLYGSDSDVDDVTCDDFSVGPFEGYCSLGPPTEKCIHCSAVLWKEERVNKNVKKGTPEFSICCCRGQIKLPKVPPTPSYLMQLYNDPEKGNNFKRNIRLYNTMFAFTSMGGRVDNSINCGRAPYIYRLNGQNHHVFGTLIPNEGKDPKFCQLYIYDTENEVENRMKWVKVNNGEPVEAAVVRGLLDMLDSTNELVPFFRMARDRFKEDAVQDLKIVMKISRADSGRENFIGPSNEVGAIMVGDLEDTCGERDIIIHSIKHGLQRISDIHPKLMALQYPLLFPRGEDGYSDDIPYEKTKNNAGKKRTRVTMKEYYSYRLQVRYNEGNTPRLGGRLFQQYIVDSFSAIEQARLWWYRTHQTTLRNDLYTNIKKSLSMGEGSTTNVGKGFILPASFLGSRRYMQQCFQDALAVCRHIGHPDIFLTMTTNPLWDEIIHMMKNMPGCLPVDSPDVTARVFKLKLDQIVDDIKDKGYFGKCAAIMYVVEFQKRGLPHVHMLIWLDTNSKKKLNANVDSFVSAEIPDPDKDPIGYKAVARHMMHGPCGLLNTKSPCMKDMKCSKHFPKKYQSQTMFDQSGFPVYKRRNTGITVKKGNHELDNQYVVPYNRDLLVKYQCHMNVEICCHARSLKYLFKYCLKGHDRATVEISNKTNEAQSTSADVPRDEIQAYFDGRYICGAEAAYRIFGFDIHYRSISVLRLSFHLPGKRNCTFREGEELHKVVQREKFKQSQLEAFFQLNQKDINARKFTYDEIPRYYVWNESDSIWTIRKKGTQLGRLLFTHHTSGEIWYLRLLLTKVRGPTSFNHLKTVDGVCCNTFKEACHKYGFLEDDNEWNELLQECSNCGFPGQIRELFVHIMVNCQVTDLSALWKKYWKSMSDDIVMRHRKEDVNNHVSISDKQLQFYVLAEIDKLLRSIGKSLQQFAQLPQPPSSFLHRGADNLIKDETSYDVQEMEEEFNKFFPNLNTEQLEVYNAVYNSVQNGEGRLFFVYGSGGCGKTYVWKTLIYKLRSMGKIVFPVASSGIAATLMPGGRTAHSRFKIPIVLDEDSCCSISHNSDIAELIKNTSLIIWDEAPMQHRYAFECLDRSLRDIMKSVSPERGEMLFGGITVLLGGDFRQILPVINLASRGEIVSACITRSRLWSAATIHILKQNMRLNVPDTEADRESLRIFADWVLKIGDGKIKPPMDSSKIFHEDDIEIPTEFCDTEVANSVENMIKWTFPDFPIHFKSPSYLSERAILTPTNQTVGHLNSVIVGTIPGDTKSYYSVDKAEDFGGTASDLNFAFPPEYLNSYNIPGLPPHQMDLKVGVAVMLMRNLNQTLGLCNGTRMMVTKCLKHCVECEVICGAFVGSRHFIPRMELYPTETKLPFKLIRKQMPLQICYSMTINKSQGQSLERVGLFLPKPAFTHGQIYVAVSRVTSPSGLRLFIDANTGAPTNITQNIVYKEVFYNLPKV